MTKFLALYLRECHRFAKIWLDTVISPLASTVLFLLVFAVIMSGQSVAGLPYLVFVFTGLMAMNVLTASFNNSAFQLVIAKNTGAIFDLQIAPLPSWQIAAAYALAGATRAVLIFCLTLLLAIWFIPELHFAEPIILAAAVLLSGLQFGLLGNLFGLIAKRFDSLPFITSFVLQPMIFLGGVFYPLSHLPPLLAQISLWNPLHHNINLIRYGFTGYADSPLWLSAAVLVSSLIIFVIGAHFLFQQKLRE